MMSRRQKTAMFVGLILGFTVFAVGGAALYLSDGQRWAAVGWLALYAVGISVTTAGLIGFRRETDPDLVDEGGHVAVEAPSDPLPPATDRDDPWPYEWLAPALAEAFEGTPYKVLSNGSSILVHADVVDARWQHIATTHKIRHVFVTRLVPTGKPGVLRRTDESRRLDKSAGPTRIGVQQAVASGRQWGYTRRIEYGLGLDGFKKRVDYEFSTKEVTQPIGEILHRAGWRTALDAESKGALVMGGLGLTAGVVVGTTLGIQALLD